ncbi:MAG: stage V sporulation protein AD [Clostridia bacterium]|nr:stage V sporulation protein AD [Clostridia bacterium]
MKRLGTQTIKLENPVSIIDTASIVGKKEGEGPLASYFDYILEDEYWGEKSFEKTESKILYETINKVLQKSKKTSSDINYILAGDLLNQCISSAYAIRDTNIPFLGLYGACSTMVESLSLGAILIDGGFANNVIAVTSSHFCTAERQFRFPLELGSQRPQTSQWTVTGSGASVLSNDGSGPKITTITTGKIIDMGIKDANNMGAAMAGAATDTIFTHFNETCRNIDYYDLIVTGDLGHIGSNLTNNMLNKIGVNIEQKFTDCGILIFDKEKQDTHAGGSGCGCCASVFSGYLYKKLKEREINKLLLIATGALMSTTIVQQGESIPGIAHAISIENL